MMKTAIAAVIGAALGGCQATPTNVAGDARPGTTAIVREADNVIVTQINGRAIERPGGLFPTLRAAPRHEVPAGPCTLVVEFSNPHAGSQFTSGAKTLKFDALAGHSYTLNSRVAKFHGGRLEVGDWDARIADDAAKKVFVAQTTDMKS